MDKEYKYYKKKKIQLIAILLALCISNAICVIFDINTTTPISYDTAIYIGILVVTTIISNSVAVYYWDKVSSRDEF